MASGEWGRNGEWGPDSYREASGKWGRLKELFRTIHIAYVSAIGFWVVP
jgi:hypothetical protein